MDKEEARRVATNFLAPYRTKRYAELVALIGTIQSDEVIAPSGVRYQVELEVFWDDPKKPKDLLRVTVAVDDRARASMPVCETFLVGPDAAFVDVRDL